MLFDEVVEPVAIGVGVRRVCTEEHLLAVDQPVAVGVGVVGVRSELGFLVGGQPVAVGVGGGERRRRDRGGDIVNGRVVVV